MLICSLIFSEDASRVLIAYETNQRSEVSRVASKHGAPIRVLGITGGDRLVIRGSDGERLVDANVEVLHAGWSSGFQESIGL